MAALSCCFHTLLLRVCLSLSPWGEDDEEEVDLRKSREKSYREGEISPKIKVQAITIIE